MDTEARMGIRTTQQNQVVSGLGVLHVVFFFLSFFLFLFSLRFFLFFSFSYFFFFLRGRKKNMEEKTGGKSEKPRAKKKKRASGQGQVLCFLTKSERPLRQETEDKLTGAILASCRRATITSSMWWRALSEVTILGGRRRQSSANKPVGGTRLRICGPGPGGRKSCRKIPRQCFWSTEYLVGIRAFIGNAMMRSGPQARAQIRATPCTKRIGNNEWHLETRIG
jgi:hypothetical protein